MTTLVGLDATTDSAYTTGYNVNGNAGIRMLATKYVAIATGTATSMEVNHLDLGDGVQSCKMFILDSTFKILGKTGAVSSPGSGASRLSSALDTSVSITSGSTYYLGIVADPAGGSGDGRFTQATDGTNTANEFEVDMSNPPNYASPPATGATVTLSAGGQFNFSINANGTIGGGSSTPIAWIRA